MRFCGVLARRGRVLRKKEVMVLFEEEGEEVWVLLEEKSGLSTLSIQPLNC